MARNSKANRTAEADFRTELEAIGAQLAKLGKRSMAEGHELAAREFDRLNNGIEDLLEQTTNGRDAAIEAVASTVRRQPVASLAAAFAGGLLIAAFVGRRGS